MVGLVQQQRYHFLLLLQQDQTHWFQPQGRVIYGSGVRSPRPSTGWNQCVGRAGPSRRLRTSVCFLAFSGFWELPAGSWHLPHPHSGPGSVLPSPHPPSDLCSTITLSPLMLVVPFRGHPGSPGLCPHLRAFCRGSDIDTGIRKWTPLGGRCSADHRKVLPVHCACVLHGPQFPFCNLDCSEDGTAGVGQVRGPGWTPGRSMLATAAPPAPALATFGK